MNAKMILDQLMKQASNIQSQGNATSKQGNNSGLDVNKIVGGLASQLSGGSRGKGQGSGGLDMKSLLGGGALGMLFGSKRGRSMGGTALKYGAIAGVGVLAWKAYQNYQATDQGSPQGAAGGAPGATDWKGARAARPGDFAGDDHGGTR